MARASLSHTGIIIAVRYSSVRMAINQLSDISSFNPRLRARGDSSTLSAKHFNFSNAAIANLIDKLNKRNRQETKYLIRINITRSYCFANTVEVLC